jgi:hypothetical protein
VSPELYTRDAVVAGPPGLCPGGERRLLTQDLGVPRVSKPIRPEDMGRVFLGSLALCLALTPWTSPASAEEAYPSAPGAAGRAPIGVRMAHTYDRGEWMVSYRYERVRQKGLRDGTRSVTLGEVLGEDDFDVAPSEMNLQAHVLGAMYAPHDRVTVAAVLPFLVLDMDNVEQRDGVGIRSYETHSGGIGDLELVGLVRFIKNRNQSLHVQLGLSIPTGSISVEDDVYGEKTPLPYPMQLGSGSVGLLPGFTYLGYYEELSWGCQLTGAIQMGRNHKDYRWRSRWTAAGWLAHSWADWISTSLRLSFDSWSDMEGEDTALQGLPSSPPADPDRQGGKRLSLGPGVNFALPGFGDKRLAVEMLWPIYQSLHGPQLETSWKLVVGIQLGL